MLTCTLSRKLFCYFSEDRPLSPPGGKQIPPILFPMRILTDLVEIWHVYLVPHWKLIPNVFPEITPPPRNPKIKILFDCFEIGFVCSVKVCQYSPFFQITFILMDTCEVRYLFYLAPSYANSSFIVVQFTPFPPKEGWSPQKKYQIFTNLFVFCYVCPVPY